MPFPFSWRYRGGRGYRFLLKASMRARRILCFGGHAVDEGVGGDIGEGNLLHRSSQHRKCLTADELYVVACSRFEFSFRSGSFLVGDDGLNPLLVATANGIGRIAENYHDGGVKSAGLAFGASARKPRGKKRVPVWPTSRELVSKDVKAVGPVVAGFGGGGIELRWQMAYAMRRLKASVESDSFNCSPATCLLAFEGFADVADDFGRKGAGCRWRGRGLTLWRCAQ